MWGFRDYPPPRVLQNRISRFYSGVHRFAPVPATNIEMNIPNIQLTRWLEMVRYHNRIAKLKPQRLPKIIYDYEINSGRKGWVREIETIARILHLPPPTLDRMYDLSAVEAAILKYSLNGWWNAAMGNPNCVCMWLLNVCLSLTCLSKVISRDMIEAC